MATLPVIDGGSISRQMKVSGSGTTGDPYVPSVNIDQPVAVRVVQGAANLATGQVTASTTAGTLVAARATRRSVTIKNSSASLSAVIGPATVTTGNGMQLLAGESITLTWVGLIQCICASGSPVLMVADEFD